MEAGGALDSERKSEIGLTPDDVLAATMAALGLDVNGARAIAESPADRVLAAYREEIAERGRPVTAVEVSRRLGLSGARVSVVSGQLACAGRMIRALDKSSGKVVYLPKAGA